MYRLPSVFLPDRNGGLASAFGVSLAVITLATASAAAFGAALGTRSKMQEALDAAVLSAVSLPTATSADARLAFAQQVFSKNIQSAGQTWLTGYKIAADADISTNFSSVAAKVRGRAEAMVNVPFVGMLGMSGIHVAVESEAERGYSDPICLLALNENEQGGFDLNGQTRVNATNCSAMTNSSSNAAMKQVGSASANALQFGVNGKVHGSGFSPPPETGVAKFDDPFAAIPFPQIGPCLNVSSRLSQAEITLKPGTYCGGLDLKAQTKVTFEPGIYVIKDGYLHIGSGTVARGEEVMFAFTGKKAQIWFNSGAVISLTSPKRGTWANFQFFLDRKNSQLGGWATIIGEVSLTYEGVFYYPGQNIWIAGGSKVEGTSPSYVMVADKLWFQDSSVTQVTRVEDKSRPAMEVGRMRIGALLTQ